MKPDSTGTSRRQFLLAAGGVAAGLTLEAAPAAAAERAARLLSRSQAPVVSMLEAIHQVVGGVPISKGKVKLELPPLIENGNVVALAVSVDSPMTQAEHVKAIHVFSEKNPQPYIATFHLGARAGRASVATRVYDYGAVEMVNLELFLMWRARGMKIETPAVRP